MTDWTTITTTLGAASITGVVGYFSARWQGHVGLEQAHEETRRLRTQHREDHLRKRQEQYQLLLDQITHFGRMRDEVKALTGTAEEAAELGEKVDQEKVHFTHVLNSVRLLGPQPVREAAEKLERLYLDVQVAWVRAAVAERSAGGSGVRAAMVPMARVDEWDSTVGELLDAMRRDVAPET